MSFAQFTNIAVKKKIEWKIEKLTVQRACGAQPNI